MIRSCGVYQNLILFPGRKDRIDDIFSLKTDSCFFIPVSYTGTGFCKRLSMETAMEKVQFMPEGETHPVDFFVLEETRLAGKQYLLVTDSEDGDGEALILRSDPEDTDSDSTYEIVEDEKELSAVLLLMRDSLEELGIEIEE